MPKMQIEELLRTQLISSLGREAVAPVDASTTIREVIAQMQNQRVAAKVVTDDGRVVGIFTERDVMNRIVGQTLAGDLPIHSVMTKDPKTLHSEDRLADAIRLMTDKGYRHIPLVDAHGKCVGMVSAGDIMDFIAERYPQEVFNLPPEPGRMPRRPEGN